MNGIRPTDRGGMNFEHQDQCCVLAKVLFVNHDSISMDDEPTDGRSKHRRGEGKGRKNESGELCEVHD